MRPDPIPGFGDDDIPNVPYADAAITVLPIRYEAGVSYGTGCRDGGLHILAASAQLERLDEETLADWGAFPIHTLPPLTPEGPPEVAVRTMRAAADRVLADKKRLLVLGGDHAVTIGPALAARQRHPEIGFLHVDAHLDLREEWNGSRFNHACVMRRIVGETGAAVVSVGIRSFSPEEHAFVRSKGGVTVVPAHEIDLLDDSWIGRAVDALPESVYLTIDLDGLDPAVLPGTGTPEPGGLSFRQLVRLIRELGRRRRVIAADIVELAVIPGEQVSEYTAARIAQKIFVYLFDPAG